MTKRMEKVKLQEDLKKLQSYRSKLESFTVSLENKFSEQTDELENTGRYEQQTVFLLKMSALEHYSAMGALFLDLI